MRAEVQPGTSATREAAGYLSLEGLGKRYRDTVAVDDVTLNVQRGEFVSLIGPSGCGKTTTLSMIAGFVTPTQGRIFLEGRDITQVAPNQRGLGVVFQNYALFPHMTVAENVGFGLEMRKVPAAERTARVAEMLALVGLSAMAQRTTSAISGGQQQRVALARALAIRPSVLLLDEPLSNLDAKMREEMQIELRRIQRTVGTTTIMVTHDQAEALALSDRIAVMHNGAVAEMTDPRTAYDRPRSAFVAEFLGRANLLKTAAGDHTWLVRPERVSITAVDAGRLTGMVHNTVFQGSRWLHEIKVGEDMLFVEQAHSGVAVPAIGSRVGLSWRDEDAHDMERSA